MKTSTTHKTICGTLCGAAALLFTASPSIASVQEGDTAKKQQVVYVTGAQDDAKPKFVTVNPGDRKQSSGRYWHQVPAQSSDGLTFYTYGPQKPDGQSIYWRDPTQSSDGLTFYTYGQQKPDGHSIYWRDPTQSSDGLTFYTYGQQKPDGQSIYWRDPTQTGDGKGIYTSPSTTQFYGQGRTYQPGITFYSPGSRKSRATASFGPKQDSNGNVSFWTTVQDDDVKSESVEVNIVNDDITVRINGKEIPQDRIKRENGRIIILDENGDEMRHLNVFVGNSQQQFEWPQFQGVVTENNLFDAFGHPLMYQPEAPKVMIGIHMDEPSAALRKHLRLADDEGLMVIGVYEGLPADEAGIGEFDVIVSVDGEPVSDGEALKAAVAEHEPGDSVQLEVIQSGRKRSIELTIVAYDAQRMAEAEVIGSAPSAIQDFWAPLGAGGVDMAFQAPDGGRWLVAPNGEDIMSFQVPRDLQFDANLNAWRDTAPLIFDGQQWRAFTEQDADEDAETGGEGDEGSQLDRLDRRIAELEKLLDRLIEQANRSGGDDEN